LKPGFLWAYISRGSALNKLKRFQEAMSDFNKALELDPENQEAYNNRGWAKKGLGDDKAACEDWKKSKKMGNEEAKIILGNSGCR
jgi:tetratricopeptide (TPR) repeat protein